MLTSKAATDELLIVYAYNPSKNITVGPVNHGYRLHGQKEKIQFHEPYTRYYVGWNYTIQGKPVLHWNNLQKTMCNVGSILQLQPITLWPKSPRLCGFEHANLIWQLLFFLCIRCAQYFSYIFLNFRKDFQARWYSNKWFP